MSNKKKNVELSVRAWTVAKSFLYFYTKFFLSNSTCLLNTFINFYFYFNNFSNYYYIYDLAKNNNNNNNNKLFMIILLNQFFIVDLFK